MDYSELISRQALRVAELEYQLEQYKQAEQNIYDIIYCIGGPLNDNKLGYTREQMSTFADIVNELII